MSRRIVAVLLGALVVAGVVRWLLDDDSPDDPVAVTKMFFDLIADGDGDGAAAYLPPAEAAVLPDLIGYLHAAIPPGWRIELNDCDRPAPGTADCVVEFIGDPVVDTLGVEGGRQQFRVEGGVLVAWGFPVGYREMDQALFAAAEALDPGGWAASCLPEPYNATCGAYLAENRDALIAAVGR